MMMRQTLVSRTPITLVNRDRKKCKWISNVVVIQCILVYIGSATILQCVWAPDKATLDYDKLARIMYLYDSQTCGHTLHATRAVSNIQLSNDTRGLTVLPIKWAPALVTVSTRLSAKTRKYIELSMAIHIAWMVVSIGLRIFTRSTSKLSSIKIWLTAFIYITVFVIIFDLSMAIVYVAHIQQSLTKGMIVRYSGWSIELQIRNYDDFGGWLPIMASICWMRGIFILALNIYGCKNVCYIRRKIEKKEFGKRLKVTGSLPIPEAKYDHPSDKTVLYYRMGEDMPFVNKSFIQQMAYGNSNETIAAIICIVMSWLTLGCKFTPASYELHEVTLMKLLYLHDPQSCGRLYFYNYSAILNDRIHTNIVWPMQNEVAADFRSKIKVWLFLHIIWMILGLANASQGSRPGCFYATLLPFTLIGVALLIVDIVYAALFFVDAGSTGTEVEILKYINLKGSVNLINKSPYLPPQSNPEDTTWISILLAYISIRGIVQWIVNFWIIKDNYFEGLAIYRRFQQHIPKNKLLTKSSEYLHV